MKPKILIIFLYISSALAVHAVNYPELADSLTAFTGYSPAWSPAVKVKNMQVNGNNVTLRTNKVLATLPLTPDGLQTLRRAVSRWVLGHENGKVRIYSDGYELADLLPYSASSCADRTPTGARHDLSGRNIALWASHGMYYNRKQDLWRWQRATLYGTVEDLLTQDMVSRWLVPLLRNAGATILSPRPFLPDTAAFFAARYNLAADSTVPREVWDTENGENDYLDDLRCRPNWVNFINRTTPVDLCLAIHTDGYDAPNDSDFIGTLAIWHDRNEQHSTQLSNGKSRLTNRMLADYVQSQIVHDMRHLVSPRWTRRQLLNANYCEARVPDVPTVLIELFSHKNFADMRYCLNQQVQQQLCRAVYKGIARYLNGTEAVILPLAPHNIAVEAHDNHWQILWHETPDSLESTARTDYYRIHITRAYTTDRGDSVVTEVHKTKHCTFSVEIEQNCRYDFHITACNRGGESLPSAAVSAFMPAVQTPQQTPQILVIDAFSRIDGPQWYVDSLTAGIMPESYPVWDGVTYAYIGQQFIYDRRIPWTDDDNCGWGMCYRDRQMLPTVGNTHDYGCRYGRILADMALAYSTRVIDFPDESAENMPFAIDSAYALVCIVMGKQQAIPAGLQHALTQYAAHGGRILFSGAYIASMLRNPAERQWAADLFGYRLQALRATHSGLVKTASGNYHLSTTPNSERLHTENPDGIAPTDSARVIARYADTGLAAAIATPNTIAWAFPLESIQETEQILRFSIHTLLDNEKKEFTPAAEY